jgi:glycogen operon protein
VPINAISETARRLSSAVKSPAGQPGTSWELGASVQPGGVTFSVYSKHADAMQLLLFDHVEQAMPAQVIDFDYRLNRTDDYWHLFVPGLRPGQLYAYRAFGEFVPSRGLRFDPTRTLLDPYARALVKPPDYDRRNFALPGKPEAAAMKSVVVDCSRYDWEGDGPPRRSFAETVIYEMHVAGFTRNPNSGVTPEKRGKYAGLIEKIPYLIDLGITAVELLPVFHYDEQDAPPGLSNYWGYSPISFFAPHAGYCSCREPLAVLDEFRDMVKALHRAGLEVILDVVYNHTAEGDDTGPTLCFRGLANETYYILKDDGEHYANFTGTGNTLKADHPVVRRLIMDSLHYWVKEMHVDGFRFDLASVLARDATGQPLASPAILWDIDTDPVLAGTKLIAEPWDPGGLYQLGSFVGDRWNEWNGKFRDDVRSFLKGDRGTVSNLACRMTASPDLYAAHQRGPEKSVNFVTSHDGFTLNDAVSYNEKHNQANGEDNADGSDSNLTWNCGAEGPSDDPAIEALRNRQVKNFLALMLLSMGTPMLLMGDEVRRTQSGNNNAYCQDNEISWFNWELLRKHEDIHRFVKMLTQMRRPQGPEAAPEMTLSQSLSHAEIHWHGVKLNQPDWSDGSHSIAATSLNLRGNVALHLIANAYWEAMEFELPVLESPWFTGWRRWIDTALAFPADILLPGEQVAIFSPAYLVQPRTVVVLVSDAGPI